MRLEASYSVRKTYKNSMVHKSRYMVQLHQVNDAI